MFLHDIVAPLTIDEAKATKTRLDPKCWKGKKIGNPKTKVKGGVRVNNCVPIEEGIGPDRNDPYEQGWSANPATAHNPYKKGTPEYQRWEAGQAERQAQPNHYDESISEDFDPDNNPWRVTDVDPISETDFEVALQGPGGQQLNFVIRPVDFMETQLERYQIDSMDVRDLQTGKTMHWGSMNDLGQWLPIFDAIDDYFWNSKPLQAQLAKIVDYHMDAGEQGKNPDLMPGLDQRGPNGVAVSADDFIASHDKTQDAIAKMKKGVAETTGDPKFDKMLKGITGKKAVAKQQKTDTKQQARDAFGSMFGGGNPADKLGIRKPGVAEGESQLYKHHQELRKKSGLPDPEVYKQMMKQKQAELDALRAEIAADQAKKNEAANPAQQAAIAVAKKKKAGVAEGERNEMDTPEFQAALAKMKKRHAQDDQNFNLDKARELGKKLAARGAAERKTKGVDEDSWHDGQNAWSSEHNQWSNESVEDRRLNRLIEYRLAEMRRAGYDI